MDGYRSYNTFCFRENLSDVTMVNRNARVRRTKGISNTCPCRSATTYEYIGNSWMVNGIKRVAFGYQYDVGVNFVRMFQIGTGFSALYPDVKA